MEIVSRYTFWLGRNNGAVSKFPEWARSGKILSVKEYINKYPDGNTTQLPYDPSVSFLDHFSTLFRESDKPWLIDLGSSNDGTEFSDCVFGAKNAYLSFVVGTNAENVIYSTLVYENVSNVLNSVFVTLNSDIIFHSHNINKSFKVFYSNHVYESNNIWFSSNLIGCSECLFCDDLQNQSYCINNQRLTKEEYILRKESLLHDRKKYDEYYSNINHTAKNINSTSTNSYGIVHSNDIEDSYYTNRLETGRNNFYINGGDGCNRFYDCFDAGTKCDDFYGICSAGEFSNNIYCSVNASVSSHIYHSFNVVNCSFCLGCIGLRNKSYCIFNQQHTKEEREEKVNEIFWQMEKDGSLGEFFPASMCPYYFNDTAAYLVDSSFTKEEVTAAWYLRRDEAIKVDIPADAEVVKSDNLDQFESFDAEWNRTISADILKKVIHDESWNYYRIIPMEYKFLMKHGIPLPRQHWLERMKQNFKIQ